MIKSLCCDELRRAMQNGTDHESCGPFIWNLGNNLYVGSSKLLSLKFCPWCRADLLKKSNLEVAARNVVDVFDEHGDWHELVAAVMDLSKQLT